MSEAPRHEWTPSQDDRYRVPTFRCLRCNLLRQEFRGSGICYAREFGGPWTQVCSPCKEAVAVPAPAQEVPMAGRIDNFLTRKAARVWPGALVTDHAHVWTLRRSGHEDVTLAADPPTPADRLFPTAREALYQLIDHETGGRRE